jgi:hypothetical protein
MTSSMIRIVAACAGVDGCACLFGQPTLRHPAHFANALVPIHVPTRCSPAFLKCHLLLSNLDLRPTDYHVTLVWITACILLYSTLEGHCLLLSHARGTSSQQSCDTTNTDAETQTQFDTLRLCSEVLFVFTPFPPKLCALLEIARLSLDIVVCDFPFLALSAYQ